MESYPLSTGLDWSTATALLATLAAEFGTRVSLVYDPARLQAAAKRRSAGA